MKITDVKTRMICHNFNPDKPLSRGYQPYHFFEYGTIVEIFTDEGIVGLGAAGRMSRFTSLPPIISWEIEHELKPSLIGKDPLNVSMLTCRNRDFAQNAVEEALWDIVGKALHVPLYKVLGGGFRDKIKVYGSKVSSPDPKDAANESLELAERGFLGLKIQLAQEYPRGQHSLKQDIARVKAVRQAVDDVELMTDANGAYTLPVAKQAAHEFEKYELTWLEEPIDGVRSTTADVTARLAEAVDLPIAGGEGLIGKREAKDVLSKRAIDIIQHNVGRNGVSESMKVCTVAEAFDVPWAAGCGKFGVETAAALHVAAAAETFMSMEYWVFPGTEVLRSKILKDEPLEMKNGYVKVPQKPGIGVELNEEEVAKYTVKEWSIPPESSYEFMKLPQEWRDVEYGMGKGRWYTKRNFYTPRNY